MMGMGRTNSGDPPPETVVAELEGTLLKDSDLFSYFMLMAFEASGLVRFTLLLMLWPVVCMLDMAGYGDAGLRLAVFVAVAGVKMAEVEAVSRAVLPKFFMEDVRLEAWRVFQFGERRVVVSKCPRVMVERFAKQHLKADEVVGCELQVNRFGYATGMVCSAGVLSGDRIGGRLMDEKADLGLCRRGSRPWLQACCKEILHPPFTTECPPDDMRPIPVIFHDGRLVRRPTPGTSLLILLWLPIGILVCIVRIMVGLILPISLIPYTVRLFGGQVIVRGRPPPPPTRSDGGVLFVCTHRTLMDPVVLAVVLGRQVPAVTYSLSRLSEILSPIRTVRLTRDRKVDAEKIKEELARGDLVVCPEGTTCREPFLLRFSALFAELTDKIVPVAMNYRVGFFHATTARGWKAMDPIFFFMNPRPVYEVTFLNQLPAEATCAAGKNPYDVANYVQRLLAATLGFECTNFTRKDKYRLLAGNDGNVTPTTCLNHLRMFVKALIH